MLYEFILYFDGFILLYIWMVLYFILLDFMQRIDGYTRFCYGFILYFRFFYGTSRAEPITSSELKQRASSAWARYPSNISSSRWHQMSPSQAGHVRWGSAHFTPLFLNWIGSVFAKIKLCSFCRSLSISSPIQRNTITHPVNCLSYPSFLPENEELFTNLIEIKKLIFNLSPFWNY